MKFQWYGVLLLFSRVIFFLHIGRCAKKETCDRQAWNCYNNLDCKLKLINVWKNCGLQQTTITTTNCSMNCSNALQIYTNYVNNGSKITVENDFWCHGCDETGSTPIIYWNQTNITCLDYLTPYHYFVDLGCPLAGSYYCDDPPLMDCGDGKGHTCTIKNQSMLSYVCIQNCSHEYCIPDYTRYVTELDKITSPTYDYHWCTGCQDSNSPYCYDPHASYCYPLENDCKKRTLNNANKQNLWCSIAVESYQNECVDRGILFNLESIQNNDWACNATCADLQQQVLFYCDQCGFNPRSCIAGDDIMARNNRMSDLLHCYRDTHASDYSPNTIYITGYGQDGACCGSISRPCGTINYAYRTRAFTSDYSSFRANGTLKLFVMGQNEFFISSGSDCGTGIIDRNLVIEFGTFDWLNYWKYSDQAVANAIDWLEVHVSNSTYDSVEGLDEFVKGLPWFVAPGTLNSGNKGCSIPFQSGSPSTALDMGYFMVEGSASSLVTVRFKGLYLTSLSDINLKQALLPSSLITSNQYSEVICESCVFQDVYMDFDDRYPAFMSLKGKLTLSNSLFEDFSISGRTNGIFFGSITNNGKDQTPLWRLTNNVFNNIYVDSFIFNAKSQSLVGGMHVNCDQNTFSQISTKTGALFHSEAGQLVPLVHSWNSNTFSNVVPPLLITSGVHNINIHNTQISGLVIQNKSSTTESDAYFDFGYGTAVEMSNVHYDIRWMDNQGYIYAQDTFQQFFNNDGVWYKDYVKEWLHISSFQMRNKNVTVSSVYALSPIIRNTGSLTITNITVQSDLNMTKVSEETAAFINNLNYSISELCYQCPCQDMCNGLYDQSLCYENDDGSWNNTYNIDVCGCLACDCYAWYCSYLLWEVTDDCYDNNGVFTDASCNYDAPLIPDDFTMVFYYPTTGDFSQGVLVNMPAGKMSVTNMRLGRNTYSWIASNFGDFYGENINTGLYQNYIENGHSLSYLKEQWDGTVIYLELLAGFFSASQITLKNCNLWGFIYQGVMASFGQAALTNVTLQYTPLGLVISNEVTYLEVVHSTFKNLGEKYMSPLSHDTNVPPMLIAPQKALILDSTFEYFSTYGLMRLDPKDVSGHMISEVVIGNCKLGFEMVSSEILYPEDNNTILNSETYGVITVRADAYISLQNCHIEWNGTTVPFVYIQTNHGAKNCWKNTEFSGGFMLDLVQGVVSSCREAVFGENVTDDMNCYDSSLPRQSGYDGLKFYLTTSEVGSCPSMVEDSENSLCLSSPIRVRGPKTHLILDQCEFWLSTLNNATDQWNVIDFEQGFVTLFDVQLYGKGTTKALFNFPQGCVSCAEIYNKDINNIMQGYFNCTAQADTKQEAFTSSNISTTTYAAEVITYDYSAKVYPGGQLQLYNFQLKDRNNNPTCLTLASDITLHLSNYQLGLTDEIIHIYKDENETSSCRYRCLECETEGLNLYQLRMKDIGKNFTVSVTNPNNLYVSNMSIQVEKCPSGWGRDYSKLCSMCAESSFSLGETDQGCYSCPSSSGISCDGGENITVSADYWMHVIYLEGGTQKLFVTGCPSGYCCQDSDGCDYLYGTASLCAENRNASVPLCGSCNDGYSELLGTVACGTCENPATWIFIFPVLFGLVFMIYLAWWARSVLINPNELPSDPSNAVAEYMKKVRVEERASTVWLKRIRSSSGLFQLLILKPMAYYYQALGYIMVQGGLQLWVTPLLQIFEFQWNGSAGHGSDSLCLFKGITAKGEILLDAFTPVLFFVQLVLLYLFHHFVLRPYGYGTLYGKKPKFGIAFAQVTLLCLSTFIGVALKFLACRRVPNIYGDDSEYITVLFFAGDSPCTGYWFYLALFFLIGCVITFVVIYQHLKRVDPERRIRRNYTFRAWIQGYKPEFWYWEFVVITRRVLIAILTTFSSYDNTTFNVTLIVIVLGFFRAHMLYFPFQAQELNFMEGFCLFALLAVLVGVNLVNSFTSSDFAYTFVRAWVGILILLPFVVLAFMIYLKAQPNIQHNIFAAPRDTILPKPTDEGVSHEPMKSMSTLEMAKTSQETNETDKATTV